MARLSKDEQAELERLQAAAAADDDDDEVELGFADGSKFRGSYRRAKQVASARGYKLEADPAKDDDDDDGKTKPTRFAGRRIS